jgi:hypothetical protein
MKWMGQVFVTYYMHFLPLMQVQIILEVHEVATVSKKLAVSVSIDPAHSLSGVAGLAATAN